MSCDGFRILTDYVDVVSNDASTPLWNPRVLPRVFNTTQLREIRLALYLSGNSGCKLRGAIDFSADGVEYPDAPKNFVAGYASSLGWNYGTWVDTWALTGVTRRIFGRIGLEALNLTGSDTESTQVRVMLEGKPFWGETLSLPVRVVHTRGSTTALFCPVSEPVPANRIREIRATVERTASSAAFSTQPGWQETDTPEDPASWSAVTLFGSASTADGYVAGTEFTTISPTKRHVRFGMSSFNPGGIGTSYEACAVVLRVDLRD